MDNHLYLTAAAVGIPLLALYWNNRQESHPPLPPGPKKDLIIGNARQFPQSHWYETFSEWGRQYGEIVSVNVLGNEIIIIGSMEIARELLVKRGTIHSGRAEMPMLSKALRWDWNLVLLQAGHVHTESRAVFRKAVGQTEVAQYDPVIQEDSASLITALEHVQGDPMDAILDAVGATVIKVAYGNSVYEAHGKELTDLNRKLLKLVTWTAIQFWLINFIPSLDHLPDWVPMPFKKTAAEGGPWVDKLRTWAWEQTVKHYEQGIAEPSIALKYLEENAPQEQLDIVRDTLGMFYGAGVDNTASMLLIFIGTMLKHPYAQKKVQQELDEKIGKDVDVTFDDRASLPYLVAALKESMRLSPTAPLGVPHSATQEDVYGGMYIPKGATLMANVGFMLRDPRVYENPEEYQPERWLPSHNPDAETLPDPGDFVFGFGRRVCPGEFLAQRTSFVMAANVLKNYTIAPLEGEAIPESWEYYDAIIRFPENVRCRFIPRSKV